MYQEKVKTLTLDKANIIFCILGEKQKEIEISLNYVVSDWLYRLHSSGIYGPDYGVSGYFRPENKYNRVIFIIDDNGPDKLYVTGCKKDSTRDKESIRFKNSKFISYYEDTEYGYLFQII